MVSGDGDHSVFAAAQAQVLPLMAADYLVGRPIPIQSAAQEAVLFLHGGAYIVVVSRFDRADGE